MIVEFPFITTRFKVNCDQNVSSLIKYHFGTYVVNDNCYTNKEIISIDIMKNEDDQYSVTVNGFSSCRMYDLSSIVGLLHEIFMDRDRFVTKNLYYLHASLFEKNNKWIAIIGPSGNGKSTISYGMVEKGFTYYTDDLVFISPDNGNVGAYIKPIYIRNIECLEKYQWRKNINELKKRQIYYEDGTKRYCFYPQISNDMLSKLDGLKAENLCIYSICRTQEWSAINVRKLHDYSDIMETIIVNTYKADNIINNIKAANSLKNNEIYSVKYHDGISLIDYMVKKYT